MTRFASAPRVVAQSARAPDAPTSAVSIERAAGKVSALERARIVGGAASECRRLVGALKTFVTTEDVTKGADRPKYDGGRRPQVLAKLLSRVRRSLDVIGAAYPLVEGANDDDRSALQAGFRDLGMIYGAVKRSGERLEFASARPYASNRAQLDDLLEQLWSLAPSVLGSAETKRLERVLVEPFPAAYPAVQKAVSTLFGVPESRYDPGPRDESLRDAYRVVREARPKLQLTRDAGVYQVGLRLASGEGSPELIAACRKILESRGCDATVPIVALGAQPSASRMEEAWSVLNEAFAERDFIYEPEVGSHYYLQRWDATVQLLPPWSPDSDRDRPKITVALFCDDLRLPGAAERFGARYPDGMQSRLRDYMRARGFADVAIRVKASPRPLTEVGAKVAVERLAAARAQGEPGHYASVGKNDDRPEDTLASNVTAIEIAGTKDADRRIVVHARPAPEGRYTPLRAVERAVRAVLDDPSSIGIPVLVLEPEPSYGAREAAWFGEVAAPPRFDSARRAEPDERQKRIARLIVDHWHERASEMADVNGAFERLNERVRSEPALLGSLSASLVGDGRVDELVQAELQELSWSEQAVFLRAALLSMAFAAGEPVGPRHVDRRPIYRALNALERLDGRLQLERAAAANGDLTNSIKRDTDRLLEGLGGPALEHARWAFDDVRAE